MPADLLATRVRLALPPRPASPRPEPRRGSRHAVLGLIHRDESGRIRRGVAIDLLDGHPTVVLVAPAPGDEDANEWASNQEIGGVPGVPLRPAVVDSDRLGRHVSRRCGEGGYALVTPVLGDMVGALAAHVRAARQGDFSISLGGCGWHHRDNGRWMDSDFRSRVRITGRDGDGVFASWLPGRRRRRSKRARPGPFIQLDVTGAALGCDTTSPATLAASVGVAWPQHTNPLDLLLAEALALVEVYRRLLADLGEVAPGLAPQDAWSAGSIATWALRRAGMRAPDATTAQLSPQAMGACAAAFRGGEATAALVGVVGEYSLVDVNRTYPALFSLLGLTSQLAAERFEEVAEDPKELVTFLGAADLRQQLGYRSTWRRWATTVVEVEPHGEILPCQREAGDRWRSVVAPLDLSGGTWWVHMFDLIEPALAGTLPRLVRAVRVDPVGIVEGLAPVRLPSGGTVDLAHDDWGAALVAERDHAAMIPDALLRARRAVLAKGLAVAGGWGIYARTDRRRDPRPEKANGQWRHPRTATVDGIGPSGEPRAIETQHPEEAGPLSLWHIASAIPAACRAVLALAARDIAALGGSVAATMTDALVVPCSRTGGLVPCPDGPHRLPDGTQAIRQLSVTELRGVIARFDPLLFPTGGSAFKAEVGTLEEPAIGIVLGVNKLLLGRPGGCGSVELARSSDTSLGDHFLDPTGSGARLADGRTAWSAALETALLAASVRAGDLRLPTELPVWADDRPAMRTARASTMAELRRLRQRAGDRSIAPFTRYVTCGDFTDGPICVGVDRDPASWRSWPWRAAGAPCRVGVLGDDDALDLSEGRGSVFVAPTLRAVLAGWLCEVDLTMTGPDRGLRQPAPVRSHPALVEVVGRAGIAVDRETAVDPLDFGRLGADELVAQAATVGSGTLAELGVPARTARRIIARGARPSVATVNRLAVAVVSAPERLCRGCAAPVTGRRQRRWCSESCRSAARRAAAGGRRHAPPPVRDPVADHTCPGCGAVLLGAARKGPCPVCGRIAKETL